MLFLTSDFGFKGSGGIGDIEFSIIPEEAEDILTLELSRPIYPK
jgi:hypothetical protein